MSLDVCLSDLVANRKITTDHANRMREVYDGLVAKHEATLGRAGAEGLATTQAMDAIDADFLHRKRMTLLQVRAQRDIVANARGVYDGGKVGDGLLPRDALLASLVRNERANGVPNVEYRWRNIKQTALGKLYGVLERHRANLIGEVRNKSDLDDVVRELGGEATGSVNARELADAWTQTAEWLRQTFNAAGGRIGKLEGWGLPHRHDGELVGAVSADEWTRRILPRLDRDKMLDRDTGEALSDGQLTDMLGSIYETIVSDGWSTRAPGAVMGKGSTGSRHAEHRVLHFRSADDWLGYQAEFGAGTAFDAMMSHVEVMSRDIASMQILGPNPNATIAWMGDLLEKEAATKGGLKDRDAAHKGRALVEGVWNEIRGQNRRVESRNLALFGATLRNWQGSTKLGSATIASMSDHATAAMSRHFNGLPSTALMGQYLKQLDPADAGDRAFARRAGIIGDELTGRMAAQGRLHMEDAFGGRLAAGRGRLGETLASANEISRRLTDGVLRASGLSAHTNAVRETMGMEFMNALATYAPLDHASLNPAFRGFLSRYGIDADGWDAIRATPTSEYKGAQWLRPDDIGDQSLRDRLFEGMLTEIDFAVPTGGLYIRSRVNSLAPGTPGGEFIRTAFQFKMFPVTVMAMHGTRAFAQSNVAKRATYAAAFMGATTIAGAMSYQLGEIAKGKDARPMEGDFWWRATLKGGGLGVFGDAIEFSRNEYGQDIGELTAGPSLSSAQTFINFGRRNVEAWSVDADDPEAVEIAVKRRGRATRDLLQREVPGASLWYIRTAYERLLVDTVASWAGEDPVAAHDRLTKRAADQGQGYWAPPGASARDWRAPDVANALGNDTAQ